MLTSQISKASQFSKFSAIPSTTSNNGLNALRGIITREAMIEYLNLQRWSRQLCLTMPVTFGLWFTLLALVSYRAHTEASFNIQNAMVEHFKGLTADLSKGASPTSLPTDSSIQQDPRCTCSCAPTGNDLCQPGLPTVASFNGSIMLEKIRYLQARSQYFEDPTRDLQAKTWDDLRTIDDVWFWVQHGFIPAVWHEVPANIPLAVGSMFGQEAQLGEPLEPPGRLLRWNQVLGGVRMRQRRVQTEACIGDARVTEIFGKMCHNTAPALEAFGPAASGEGFYAEGFMPESSERGAFDVYLDIERPVYEIFETTQHSLKDLGWLDHSTSELLLQTAFLNGEVIPSLYGLLEVHFIFDRSGMLRSSIRVVTSAAEDYPGGIYVALDVIWIILVLTLLGACMHKVVRRCMDGSGDEQFMNFWMVLDWITLLVSVAIFAGRMLISTDASGVAEKFAQLPSSPPPFGAELADRQAYQSIWMAVLDNVIHINQWMEYYRLSLFAYAILLTFQVFKVLRGQPRLARLAFALWHAAEDVLHFIIIFLVLFLSFAFSGFVIYGLTLQQWSSPARAINTCFRSLLGDTDLAAMYEVAPISTVGWYYLFLTIMIFLMLNLLLAITYDHYLLVKRKSGQTAGILLQTTLTFRDIRNRFHGMRCVRFCSCCRRSRDFPPHGELMQDLIDLCELPPEERSSAFESVLGLRMHRKQRKRQAFHRGEAHTDPTMNLMRMGVEEDLHRFEIDPDYHESLMDECNAQALRENGREETQVAQLQELVHMAEDMLVVMRHRVHSCQEVTKSVMYEFMSRLEVLERKVHASLADLVHIASCAGVSDAKPPQSTGQRAKLDNTVGALRSLSNDTRSDALLSGSVGRVLDHLGQSNAFSDTAKSSVHDWHRAMRRVDTRGKRVGPNGTQ